MWYIFEGVFLKENINDTMKIWGSSIMLVFTTRAMSFIRLFIVLCYEITIIYAKE